MNEGLKQNNKNWFRKGELHTMNSFLFWLNYLLRTPKKDWEKQIITKVEQIYIELNGDKKSNE